MFEMRVNTGRPISLADSEEEIEEQQEEATSSSSGQRDKPQRTKRSQLRYATVAEGQDTMRRSAAFERQHSAAIVRSLDTIWRLVSESRIMLELEEADLGGVEVLEGPEEELHLYSLVRNCCRTERRRKLEGELLRSFSRRS